MRVQRCERSPPRPPPPSRAPKLVQGHREVNTADLLVPVPQQGAPPALGHTQLLGQAYRALASDSVFDCN